MIRAKNAAQLLLPKQVKVDVCNPLSAPREPFSLSTSREPFSILNPPYHIDNGKEELYPLQWAVRVAFTVTLNRKLRIAPYPDEKPFVLTRSSFVATGRFAAHFWLGDNYKFSKGFLGSNFNYLENYIAGILSFQLYGIPQVGADIGGFNRNTTENLMIRLVFVNVWRR
ncbi:glycosyl hydrolases family 31-domain-containing protein [Endogone sp. FLAS-F59071]|nr:glycosyl hydrolases family 31-domain-containing protein [Endogone sp. FLAS-F59071]|eukprot:RUS15246.1 glycosyl hydrolases family 31-domain-containing protein [Endogone sp. FLAS-F59071]